MVYPSRLRPRAAGGRAGNQQQNTGGILDSARARIARHDENREVSAKIDPLDVERLKQEELQARMVYGRARREGKGGFGLVLPALGWGLARANRTRLLRAVNLFFFHYGTVMAAGAAYMMFFSVAAMLFAGFAIAGLVIGGNQEYQELIVRAVNTAIPGIIGKGGLATPEQLFQTRGLNLALLVSLVVAVVTSLSWVHGLRSGMRSIWERPLMAENVLVVKARDLGIMLVLVIIVLSTAVIGVVTTFFIEEILHLLGWELDGIASRLTRVASLVIAFGLDMFMAVVLMRGASRLSIPVSVLWQSALIAGIGASLLRLGSSQLLQNYADAPLLKGFATVLGLFFYFYLFSLVYLVASAWGAIAAADHSAKVG